MLWFSFYSFVKFGRQHKFLFFCSLHTSVGKCILAKQAIGIVLSMCIFAGAGAPSLYSFSYSHVINAFLLSRNQWKHQILRINFLLAQKFRLSGVKMESGMLRNKDILILTICFFPSPFLLPTFLFCVWLVEYSGMMQLLRLLLQMGIMSASTDGETRKRYHSSCHMRFLYKYICLLFLLSIAFASFVSIMAFSFVWRYMLMSFDFT